MRRPQRVNGLRAGAALAATSFALASFPHAARADEGSVAGDAGANAAAPPSPPSVTTDAPLASPAEAPLTTPPAPEPTEERKFVMDERMKRLYERRTTLDVTLEGGLGRVFSDPGKTIGFGRARAGVLFLRLPVFGALGATYEYSGLAPATLGVQAEVGWWGGFWGQAGVMRDTDGHNGAMVAAGFALLGVEGELRDAERTGSAWAVYAKLHVPVSFLVMAALSSSK